MSSVGIEGPGPPWLTPSQVQVFLSCIRKPDDHNLASMTACRVPLGFVYPVSTWELALPALSDEMRPESIR